MGTFTLHADFNELDGTPSITKSVSIASNVQVLGPNGVIFDAASATLNAGVLEVELPADDNEPGDFGYVVRRATGVSKVWRIPAQPSGTTVELADFTDTTPLPVPPGYGELLDGLTSRVVTLEQDAGGDQFDDAAAQAEFEAALA